ncbi:MAG: hypothetical protein AAGB12_16435 [Pseudomonadota bacterium]
MKNLRNMCLSVFLIIFVTFDSPSIAYDGWSSGGGTIVTRFRIYPDGSALLNLQSAENPGECSDSSYILLKADSPERQFSALLAAYMAQKPVRLALNGCSSNNKAGYPVISEVWLY